jgi:hypothetical protein
MQTPISNVCVESTVPPCTRALDESVLSFVADVPQPIALAIPTSAIVALTPNNLDPIYSSNALLIASADAGL